MTSSGQNMSVADELPSKVLNKDEGEKSHVICGDDHKRKIIFISSLSTDFLGALPPSSSEQSMPQVMNMVEGSPIEAAGVNAFDLNQKIEDGQDNEENPKMKVVAAEKENNKEVKASDSAAAEFEAEPVDASLIEKQNGGAVRIVRDIDLNELPPEFEEDD
ncbi:hypothetical protein TanjilG_22081 [Lupinus angustifolius]|uniref:Uncharacterized protein n=1 Tax=Lupinus angustifolius TaxID=3871 RepID=A0A4P1QUC4_LUPAN|nr:hypothetical protein TanjilG_22081 [Lupinus angustifolius]